MARLGRLKSWRSQLALGSHSGRQALVGSALNSLDKLVTALRKGGGKRGKREASSADATASYTMADFPLRSLAAPSDINCSRCKASPVPYRRVPGERLATAEREKPYKLNRNWSVGAFGHRPVLRDFLSQAATGRAQRYLCRTGPYSLRRPLPPSFPQPSLNRPAD
eukprot:214762-Chlamydomonas_euryale.AAC.5